MEFCQLCKKKEFPQSSIRVPHCPWSGHYKRAVYQCAAWYQRKDHTYYKYSRCILTSTRSSLGVTSCTCSTATSQLSNLIACCWKMGEVLIGWAIMHIVQLHAAWDCWQVKKKCRAHTGEQLPCRTSQRFKEPLGTGTSIVKMPCASTTPIGTQCDPASSYTKLKLFWDTTSIGCRIFTCHGSFQKLVIRIFPV